MDCIINVRINQIIIKNNQSSAKVHKKEQEKEHQEEREEFQTEKIERLLNEKYAPKKCDNMHLAAAYNMANIDNGKDKAKRLALCSRWLEFAVNEEEEKSKLVKSSSCHVRLCPVCQWRRSLNTYRNMSKIYSLPEVTKCKHLFLTLTQKNVPEGQLGEELKKTSKAFTNMMKRKELKSVVLGYMRSTEVTRNKSNGTYHPHIHAILTVPASYGSREYITRAKFSEMWGAVQNLDYEPIIDVRMIKKLNGKTLAEIAKYSVKPTDYIAGTESDTAKIIETLDAALDGKRFVSCGGMIKELKRKILGNKDIESEEADPVENFEEWEKIVYEWHFGTQKYNRIL